MKKSIISLLAFFAANMGAAAQTISVAGDIEALASGETVSFNLHIAEAVEMTSMHFEVVLPSTFTVSAVTPTQAWMATFSYESGVVGAMSPTTSAFSGEGDIATIQLTVPANTTIDSYPITINNVRVNGTSLETTATFNVQVVERHTVLLDEESLTPPTSANGVDVRVKRTINANEWSTICLPFAICATDMNTAFGEDVDVELGDFTGYVYDEDAENITVSFADAEAIAANHPYIIRVSKAVTQIAVNGVDIDPEDEPKVATVKRTRKQWSEMIGTYVANFSLADLLESDIYPLFLSGNKFWYASNKTKDMKAFRAYFDFYDYLSEAETASSRIIMSFDNNETTGIRDNHHESVMNKHYYNLSGQKVKNPANGIYVKDGKKVIIK